MEKEQFDFNPFLQELDSREELVEFNPSDYISKYSIDEIDVQHLTYEYISFSPIDYLIQLLNGDDWVVKKEEYKIYLLNRFATTCSNLNKSQYLTILAKCFKTNVDDAWRCLKTVFSEYLLKNKYYGTTKILLEHLSSIGLSNKKYRDEFYNFLTGCINCTDISDKNLIFLLGWLTSTYKFQYQLTKINNIFEVCISLVAKTNEPQLRKHIIELALQVREKLTDEDKQKYAIKRKELYEQLADNEYSFILPDDPNNAAVPIYNHMFLRNILQWYKLAGNAVKAAKAEKKLWEVKKKIIIPSFPVTIYTPEQVDVLNHILEFSYCCPASIFLWVLSEDFFKTIPSDSFLKKSTENSNGIDGFGFTHLDYNYNCNNISDAEEQNYRKFFIYDLCAKPSIKNFILVFLQRIKEDTLCYKDVYEFLTLKTNFGKTYTSYNNDVLSNYNLIEKGLKHLFYQFKKFALGNTPDFTLSIDSLCPKIERILREMLHSVQASILKVDTKTSSPKKETMLLLDNLLDAAEIRKFASDEDLNFLRYVLTNDGQNIRNYSAHGLYSPSFYKSEAGLISGFLIFVLIIRLAVISNLFHYE